MANSGPDPVISGVPLAQYAAVTAALGESFPLKAVLAVEGLDAARWAKADLGWTQRLAEDAALLGRYEAELAAAQDRLGRSVEPIDADLGAWLSFLSAIARTPELLEQHGLGPDDVARLQRRWDARMKEEPALVKRAVELQREGPGKLPRLRVVKGKLTRSGAGVAVGMAAASPAATGPAAAGPAPAAVPEPAPPSRAAKPPGPRELREESPAPPGPEDRGTQASFHVPTAFLPFGSTPSSDFLEARDRPAAAEGEGSDGATVALRGVAALRALQIREDAPVPDATLAGAVMATMSPFVSNPLPFAPAPMPIQDEPPPGSDLLPGQTVMMRVPPPPRRAAPEEGTQLIQSPLSRKALPFGDADGGDPAGRTLALRVPRKLPRVPPPAPPPGKDLLSLAQHASLCVEIAVDPVRADEALARYQVSVADKEYLDDFYRALLDADPELRAQWNRAFEIYRAWFTSQPRP